MPRRLILSPFYLLCRMQPRSVRMSVLVRLLEYLRQVRTLLAQNRLQFQPWRLPAFGLLTIPFTDSLEAIGRNSSGTSKHELCFNGAEIARSSTALSFHRVKQRLKRRSCDFGLGHPYGGQGRSRELGEVGVIEPDYREVAGNN